MQQFIFNNKTIAIFSPQRWEERKISKHHYALALAKDNRVFYISAPEKGMGTGYRLEQPEEGKSLTLIKYHIPLPYAFQFHFPWLYRQINKYMVQHIIQKEIPLLHLSIDFGCYGLYEDMGFVNAVHKIYFLADDLENLVVENRGADYCFSVSSIVVEKFKRAGIPCHFINHGLGDAFVPHAQKALELLDKEDLQVESGKLQVAYAGNLLIKYLDIIVLKSIITAHPEIIFHFFGSLGDTAGNPELEQWKAFLQSSDNIKLHGLLSGNELARQFHLMDAFLFCYRPDYKNYHAENSHKILEYLSTGKIIISTHLSLFEESPLFVMTPKDVNEELPALFNKVISDLKIFNNYDRQQERIHFSLQNTYEHHIQKIAEYLSA